MKLCATTCAASSKRNHHIESLLGLAEEIQAPYGELQQEHEEGLSEVRRLVGEIAAARKTAGRGPRRTGLHQPRHVRAQLEERLEVGPGRDRSNPGRSARALRGIGRSTRRSTRSRNSPRTPQDLLKDQEQIESQLRTAEAERNTVKEVIERIQDQLDTAREEFEAATKARAHLQERFSTQVRMEENLRLRQAERAQLQEELTHLREELAECQQAAEDAEREQARLESLTAQKEGIEHTLEGKRKRLPGVSGKNPPPTRRRTCPHARTPSDRSGQNMPACKACSTKRKPSKKEPRPSKPTASTSGKIWPNSRTTSIKSAPRSVLTRPAKTA